MDKKSIYHSRMRKMKVSYSLKMKTGFNSITVSLEFIWGTEMASNLRKNGGINVVLNLSSNDSNSTSNRITNG